MFDTDDSSSNIGMTTVVLDTTISDDAQRVVVEDYLKGKINCIRSFRIVGNFFSSNGYRSPTLKGLRTLLQCIREMSNLEELDLCGDMHLENPHDIQVLCDALRNHPSLRSIKLRNFLIYTRHNPGSVPLLDPLAETIKSIQNLREFHVSCGAVFWDRRHCLLSTEILQSVCRTKMLQSLALSGVKLTDDHFLCLGEELAPQILLTELILNRNVNTNKGLRAVAERMLSKDSNITRLEMYNGARASKSTSEYLLQLLYANHTLHYFRINARFEYRAEMDFVLLLNRSGRKTILDPEASMQDVLAVFQAAGTNNNMSGLMYFLQANPGILQYRRNEMRDFTDNKKQARLIVRHEPQQQPIIPTYSGIGNYLKTSLLPGTSWWKATS
jgi:hypothetical protein